MYEDWLGVEMTCKRKAQRSVRSLQLVEEAPRSVPSLPFIWWALGLALTAGFTQGLTLFVLLALGQPIGPWWVAAAQAHGHVQIYGWAGMFALGVGLHFLPRLRGCAAPSPRIVRLAAWMLGAGLTLRAISQPLAAALDVGALYTLLRAGVALSGALEFIGAGAAVVALFLVARNGPPLASRVGLIAVLPFALSFFVALLAGLAANAYILAEGAFAGRVLIPAPQNWTLTHLGLVGMLVSISAAISARTLPSYLQSRVPPRRELYATFAILLIGFVLRSLDPPGVPFTPAWAGHFGAFVEGLAMLTLVLVLGVPFSWTWRVQSGPSEPEPPEYRASALLILSAYLWLAVAGALLMLEPLAGSGARWNLPPDAERHALGAGLITLLILGMAVRLLPGFAGQRLFSARLVWATLWLGNAAALLRVVPLFLPPTSISLGLLATSGVLALAAVGCLTWNLIRTLVLPSALPGHLIGGVVVSPPQPGAVRSPLTRRSSSL